MAISQGALNKSVQQSAKRLSREWVDAELYSSVVTGAAATTTTLNFFQDSISSVGKAKTNMETPAQLNSGKVFLVQSLKMIIFNRDGAPLRSDNAIAYGPNIMAATMYGDFRINQQVALDIQGWMFRDPFERVDAATTVGGAGVNTGMVKQYHLTSPIKILPQTNFILGITLLTPAAATGGYSVTVTEIMFSLKGLMSRKN